MQRPASRVSPTFPPSPHDLSGDKQDNDGNRDRNASGPQWSSFAARTPKRNHDRNHRQPDFIDRLRDPGFPWRAPSL
jgi:hypothetical protein